MPHSAAPPVSRRERLRIETTAEIKGRALALLQAGGPDAISLRAIAREMGMTAGAIYSYFPARNDLLDTLVDEVYAELVARVGAAVAARPAGDTAGRIVAYGEAFRAWALATPAGFRLIYGDAVPGYEPSETGAGAAAERQLCHGLIELAAAAWPTATAGPGGADLADADWSGFTPEFAELARDGRPQLPAGVAALALRLWGRMHGPVALEVGGHLRGQLADPGPLFAAELRDIARSLGV